MLGPTGRFPRGRLNRKDRGELSLAIGLNEAKHTVELHFGTELTWLGLGPDEAEVLGRALLEGAAKLRQQG